jgi:cell division transport system permease protein
MSETERAHRLQVAAYRRQSRLAGRRTSHLVPENTVASNALTIVIALMSFLACLTLGAVTLVRQRPSPRFA